MSTRRAAAPIALLLKVLAIAVVLAGVKVAVHMAGWEFIQELPLLTGLMGAVVFTLAILLQATIRDYKEAEQLVAQLTALIRRIDAELHYVAGQALRPRVVDLGRRLAGDLSGDDTLHASRIHQDIHALDEGIRSRVGPDTRPPQLRTIQVFLMETSRIIERLEAIIETSAIRTGYHMAVAAVAASLVGFLFAVTDSALEAGLLYGFASLLLVGLYLLVHDIDNPFAGYVRVRTTGMDRVVEHLERRLP